jgi:hypothetical protein
MDPPLPPARTQLTTTTQPRGTTAIYEALGLCFGVGLVFLLFPKPMFDFTAPGLKGKADDMHMFSLRLFGLVNAGFGLLLYNFYSKANTATRLTILRVLLFGDLMHLYAVSQHVEDTFWDYFSILTQVLATTTLLTARIVYISHHSKNRLEDLVGHWADKGALSEFRILRDAMGWGRQQQQQEQRNGGGHRRGGKRFRSPAAVAALTG